MSDQISYPISYKDMKDIHDCPIICIDADNFYTTDILNKWNGNNAVITFNDKSSEPKYSYVIVNDNNYIDTIIEKEKISDIACCGAYGFNSYYLLRDYCQNIIHKNLTQKNEFYISGIIKEMINNDIQFYNYTIYNKNYFSLGTPEQIKEYESPFLFDLDGTLVNTDKLYMEVWNTIMKKYNLSIDIEFFKFFIQGKNDSLFLKNMIPGITSDEMNNITDLKDNLFIKLLKDVENNEIIIDGSCEFIEKNKNRQMAIVTSCNKKSAEFIVNKLKMNEYIQFIIAAEDTVKHKPDKEPYELAINKLNVKKKNCTIFEDSNSGYKSAKSIGEVKICLITNQYSSQDILNTSEYKIESYNNFNYDNLTSDCNSVWNGMFDMIKSKLKNICIKDIKIDKNNLKTGYICDIQSLKLILNDQKIDIVLKIENDDNELSNVARNINLYNNESYFYNEFSDRINIPIPKFYCSFKINKKDVIILENLNNYNGEFNLDLNNNIDLLLIVVRYITLLHNRYLFLDESYISEKFNLVEKFSAIEYYPKLIEDRFEKFLLVNNLLILQKEKDIITRIYQHFHLILKKLGSFPLNFCHGDVKSPNIFYKNNDNGTITPIFLDWQYIQINKGISDISFLLVESTSFDEITNSIIINYYYKLSNMYNTFDECLFDFKLSLCGFPFVVMIWFNTENRDKLLDKVFPINFMKNLLKFYDFYLDDDFFRILNT